MAPRTNGHVETPAPSNGYLGPQVGRPRGTGREPVKAGLAQALRTLKEITTNWSYAVRTDETGRSSLIDKDAAELCDKQLRMLAAKLLSLTGDVEKRISDG